MERLRSIWSRSESYEALAMDNHKADSHDGIFPKRGLRVQFWKAILLLPLFSVAVILGNVAGRRSCRGGETNLLGMALRDLNLSSQPCHSIDKSIAPAGTVDTVFNYSRDFAQEPTAETNHLWNQMFPSKDRLHVCPAKG